MADRPLRVGLIGYGAIGQGIVHLITGRFLADITVVGALVRHPAHQRPPGHPHIFTTLPALLHEHPHVIVEVAGHEGLREHGPAILRVGVDLVLVSVGALAEEPVLRALLEAAQQGNARAKIASGAIGALDALAAASLGGLTSVVYTMRRSPASLLPSEEVACLTAAREVFRGSARQAAQQFPEFLNVAAAVALASRGFDQTEVRVVADPAVKHSLHQFEAEGAFGVLRFEIENAPISLPAYGARLVAMSIVHTLLSYRIPLMIG